ncbi:hypothetical protein RHSIM_Rhsim03G0209700 [Rhododendron simsii]|uniref:Uncharacterized protein n=1 Tax=Rhododendron simsii TaxID=118357 RepID=A0A834HBN8_RHOSS|nr:hypothetical protein RHSIM_Rhsim03G0209700 [Rhododendron simsii]
METVVSSVTLPIPREPANYDEVSMQQSLLFSDSLKDLKNLRSQLYSAAEYFELSYTNDDQKHIVVDTLKEYAIKALVNTVDHLGSVTYKVNDLLDEKVDEVSGTELRVSCIEQRSEQFHRIDFLFYALDLSLALDLPLVAQFPSEPRKSASMRIRPEKGKENSKEIELFPSKSKRLLKALLSRRKSKKDEMLYTYLDEY